MRRVIGVVAIALAMSGCATTPPAVDLKAEIGKVSVHPAWRPEPPATRDDGHLVIAGVPGPGVEGVTAAGTCGAVPGGDLWFFPGNPEIALTVGWGDAPAALVHAPSEGCLKEVPLLPGGVPGGVTPSFDRREVFDTCATGSAEPPTFRSTTGTLTVTAGVEGFGVGIGPSYASKLNWEEGMCGSGSIAVSVYESGQGTYARFAVDVHQEGDAGNRQLLESTELRLTQIGPVVLSRVWSISTAWGEEGESEETEKGEASLGWLWGQDAILRTEGYTSEKIQDHECSQWTAAEFGSWSLRGVVLDAYDELESGDEGCGAEE